MKKFRLLSAFLTVVMVAGSLSAFSLSAADAKSKTDEPLVPGIDEETGVPTISYLTEKFATPEDKLATMTKYLSKGNYELYVEPVSGEIAYVNVKTRYSSRTRGISRMIPPRLLSRSKRS